MVIVGTEGSLQIPPTAACFTDPDKPGGVDLMEQRESSCKT